MNTKRVIILELYQLIETYGLSSVLEAAASIDEQNLVLSQAGMGMRLKEPRAAHVGLSSAPLPAATVDTLTLSFANTKSEPESGSLLGEEWRASTRENLLVSNMGRAFWQTTGSLVAGGHIAGGHL